MPIIQIAYIPDESVKLQLGGERLVGVRWRLPYGFRTGRLHRFRPPQSRHRLFVHNCVEIREEMPHDELRRRYDEICSDVFVLLNPKEFSETHRSPGTAPADFAIDYAVPLFNDFRIAFLLATKVIYDDELMRACTPQRLWCEAAPTPTVIFDLHVPRDYELTDKDLTEIFQLRSPIIELPRRLYAMPPDLQQSELSGVMSAFERHDDDISHQFDFETLIARRDGDGIKQLLMACITLEAVHARFLRTRLAARDPDLNVEEACSNLLRDYGLYKIIRLTPSLVMAAEERPSTKVIEDAIKGVEARNAIMHALRKKGVYKFRGFYGARKLERLAEDVRRLAIAFRRAGGADEELRFNVIE